MTKRIVGLYARRLLPSALLTLSVLVVGLPNRLGAQAPTSRILDTPSEAVFTTLMGERHIVLSKAGDDIYTYALPDSSARAMMAFVNKTMTLHMRLAPQAKNLLPGINEFNAAHKGVRAYVMEGGRLAINMEIDFQGGVTEQFVRERIAAFELAAHDFVRFVNNAK